MGGSGTTLDIIYVVVFEDPLGQVQKLTKGSKYRSSKKQKMLNGLPIYQDW